MRLKEIFNEHKWRWVSVALVIFFAGCITARWLNVRDARSINAPAAEITAADEASRKISQAITKVQIERDRLSEVVKDAKKEVILSVGSDTDGDIVRRWNSLLGRYREGCAASGRVYVDQ